MYFFQREFSISQKFPLFFPRPYSLRLLTNPKTMSGSEVSRDETVFTLSALGEEHGDDMMLLNPRGYPRSTPTSH